MSDATESQVNVELDVREDLRNGQEPFSKIMAAAAQVAPGGALTLYATFKPVPLIAILKRQGFTSEAEKIEGGDWRVIFRRTRDAGDGEAAAALPNQADGAAKASSGDGAQAGGVIELDNRGLEPPMPMVQTLEAINQLQPGGRIVGYYDRRPMFLIPKLDQMGFVYDLSDLEGGGVKLEISRKS